MCRNEKIASVYRRNLAVLHGASSQSMNDQSAASQDSVDLSRELASFFAWLWPASARREHGRPPIRRGAPESEGFGGHQRAARRRQRLPAGGPKGVWTELARPSGGNEPPRYPPASVTVQSDHASLGLSLANVTLVCPALMAV